MKNGYFSQCKYIQVHVNVSHRGNPMQISNVLHIVKQHTKSDAFKTAVANQRIEHGNFIEFRRQRVILFLKETH